MEDKKVIMYESPEAARYVTNIEGWIDAQGRFWGKGDDGERMARYSSHTHKVCECGGLAKRGWLRCENCIRKSERERYLALPYKEWDGIAPVCTWDGDTYFFNLDELIDYMTERDSMESIDLLFCDPVHYSSIDFETIAGEAHEDWEPEEELCKKVDEFNAYLKTLPPHSYCPGKVRTSYKLEDTNL